MSEAKHTTGPWGMTPDGTQVITTTSNSRPIIADIRSRGVYGRETRKANARLIAAAPDLLEVLERCADFMGSVAGTENVSDTFKQALRDARAAIAKATGQEVTQC